MREQLFRHHVVRVDSVIDVLAVDPDGHPHQHLLRSLGNFPVDLEQIRPFKSFETKILVAEIAVVDDGGVETVRVLLDDLVMLLGDHGGRPAVGLDVVEVGDDLAELLLGLLVQVGHDDPEK